MLEEQEQRSFKVRVRDEAIRCAQLFKCYFVDYEYLICSEAFINAPYYIVESHTDNYKHLTGVSSSISPEDFFNKCYVGTLTVDDFSFIKQGQTETAVKGSVRRKINSLPSIMNIFDGGATVEEEFKKNRIKCSFATANGICTLGFTKSIPTKPMTLLKGNQLDKEKSKPIALVLRRKSGEAKFSEVIIGGEAELKYYFDNIKDLLSETLFPSETLNADDQNQDTEVK